MVKTERKEWELTVLLLQYYVRAIYNVASLVSNLLAWKSSETKNETRKMDKNLIISAMQLEWRLAGKKN